MFHPSAPWMITQKCKVAPRSFLGGRDLKHQKTEQLDKTGRSTVFCQEMEDLNTQNVKGKAQLMLTGTPLAAREGR